jgi:hypothetical protein
MEANFPFEAVVYNPEGKIREAKSREPTTAGTSETASNSRGP